MSLASPSGEVRRYIGGGTAQAYVIVGVIRQPRTRNPGQQQLRKVKADESAVPVISTVHAVAFLSA
jgi:hypothetical protein